MPSYPLVKNLLLTASLTLPWHSSMPLPHLQGCSRLVSLHSCPAVLHFLQVNPPVLRVCWCETTPIAFLWLVHIMHVGQEENGAGRSRHC